METGPHLLGWFGLKWGRRRTEWEDYLTVAARVSVLQTLPLGDVPSSLTGGNYV